MQTVFGPYTVEAEIGRGGMGVVYRARHTVRGQVVALKVLAIPEDDHKAGARFQREIRGGSRLEHPHLVHIYEGGSEGGLQYLAMELVEGQSLLDLLRRQRTLSWPLALAINSFVLDGLSYLHSLEMLHRDIKPANILIGRDGQVKVTDYGLLIWTDATMLTTEGAVMGSMAFLAPELLHGDAASRATDLWSAGVTLYTCLTGTLPIHWQPAHFLESHDPIVIVPPKAPDSQIPDEVADLVMQMLAFAPQERLQDAAAAKAQVDALLLRHAECTAAAVLTQLNLEHPERVRKKSTRAAPRKTLPPPKRRVPVAPLLLVLALLVALPVAWYRGGSAGGIQPVVTKEGDRPICGEAPVELAAGWNQGSPILAEGDLDGDGFPDLIEGAAPGSPGIIRIYSGFTGELMRTIPLRPEFRGGLNVAAVDFNGDGTTDVVCCPGEGWDSVVRVFNGKDGQLLNSIRTYSPKWFGGANVAAGRGPPGRPWQVFTGPLPGGGPHVTVLSPPATAVFHSFFAFDTMSRNGARVACVDVNADGIDDLVATSHDPTPPIPPGRVFDGRNFSWLYTFPIQRRTAFDGWRACYRRRRELAEPRRAAGAVRLLKRECALSIGENPEHWLGWGQLGAWLTGATRAASFRDPHDRMGSNYLDTVLLSLESVQVPNMDQLDAALGLLVGGNDARGWFLLGQSLESDSRPELAKLAYNRGVSLLPERCFEVMPRVIWRGMVHCAMMIPGSRIEERWRRWAKQGADLGPLTDILKELPPFRQLATELKSARH